MTSYKFGWVCCALFFVFESSGFSRCELLDEVKACCTEKIKESCTVGAGDCALKDGTPGHVFACTLENSIKSIDKSLKKLSDNNNLTESCEEPEAEQGIDSKVAPKPVQEEEFSHQGREQRRLLEPFCKKIASYLGIDKLFYQRRTEGNSDSNMLISRKKISSDFDQIIKELSKNPKNRKILLENKILVKNKIDGVTKIKPIPPSDALIQAVVEAFKDPRFENIFKPKILDVLSVKKGYASYQKEIQGGLSELIRKNGVLHLQQWDPKTESMIDQGELVHTGGLSFIQQRDPQSGVMIKKPLDSNWDYLTTHDGHIILGHSHADIFVKLGVPFVQFAGEVKLGRKTFNNKTGNFRVDSDLNYQSGLLNPGGVNTFKKVLNTDSSEKGPENPTFFKYEENWKPTSSP